MPGRGDEERRRLSTADRRAQLLEVGLTLYAERGFADVPIDDIAERAGVSKGLLYHYFASKRGFHLAVLDHAAARVLEAIEPDPELPPAARALAGISSFVELVQSQRGIYLALIRSGQGADAEVAERVERVRQGVLRLVTDALGPPGARPAFRVALWSWIVGVEAGVVRAVEEPGLEADALVRIFAQQLRGSLRAAVSVDPDCGIDFDAHPGLRPEEVER